MSKLVIPQNYIDIPNQEQIKLDLALLPFLEISEDFLRNKTEINFFISSSGNSHKIRTSNLPELSNLNKYLDTQLNPIQKQNRFIPYNGKLTHTIDCILEQIYKKFEIPIDITVTPNTNTNSNILTIDSFSNTSTNKNIPKEDIYLLLNFEVYDEETTQTYKSKLLFINNEWEYYIEDKSNNTTTNKNNIISLSF